MKRLMTRQERKLAARLQMNELRKARKRGIWSDGNRIYRGAEIDERIGELSRRLINDIDEKRSVVRRFSNAMSALSMIRRKPEIHNLPKAMPDMLAARARNTYVGALRHTPGSLDHFILARRLARKVGSLSARDYPFGAERERLEREFEKPTAFLVPETIEIDISYDDDDTPTRKIDAGTRLFGRGDELWTCPDGIEVEIGAHQLLRMGVTPLRLRRSEKRILELPGPTEDISDPSPL